MATETNFRVIGKSPIRHDGTDKVTGRALYGADMNLPGMLYGKVLRSPHPHARIKSIDLSDLKKHPECKAIVTSKDLAPAPEITMRTSEISLPTNSRPFRSAAPEIMAVPC